MNVLSPVIPLGTSQAEPLANVLSRILCDEPRFTYWIPDGHERRLVLPRFFRGVIRASQLYGETYTTPAVEGASLWIGPGRNVVMEQLLPHALAKMSFWTEEIRQRMAQQPHWYLLALGVESSSHATDLQRALIEPVLSRADSDCRPCYLETFSETNLPFYKENGFRIEGGGKMPSEGPNYWVMIRTPGRR